MVSFYFSSKDVVASPQKIEYSAEIITDLDIWAINTGLRPYTRTDMEISDKAGVVVRSYAPRPYTRAIFANVISGGVDSGPRPYTRATVVYRELIRRSFKFMSNGVYTNAPLIIPDIGPKYVVNSQATARRGTAIGSLKNPNVITSASVAPRAMTVGSLFMPPYTLTGVSGAPRPYTSGLVLIPVEVESIVNGRRPISVASLDYSLAVDVVVSGLRPHTAGVLDLIERLKIENGVGLGHHAMTAGLVAQITYDISEGGYGPRGYTVGSMEDVKFEISMGGGLGPRGYTVGLVSEPEILEIDGVAYGMRPYSRISIRYHREPSEGGSPFTPAYTKRRKVKRAFTPLNVRFG